MRWTAEDKQAVFGLWNDGLSASMIAQKYGTTANAIIGMVHRARGKGVLLRVEPPTKRCTGLTKPPSDRYMNPLKARAKRMQDRERVAAIEAVAGPMAVVPAPSAEGRPAYDWPLMTWATLEPGDRRCRYPVDGLGLAIRYCGKPAAPGLSYCPACAAYLSQGPVPQTKVLTFADYEEA